MEVSHLRAGMELKYVKENFLRMKSNKAIRTSIAIKIAHSMQYSIQ